MSEPSRPQPKRDPAPLRPVLVETTGPLIPEPPTPFLARETELAAVRDLLHRDSVRLVTLIGPGGVGKTRIAIRAATEMSEQYPDGAIWVPLVDIRDPALVGPSVSRAIQASRPARLDADPISSLRKVRGLLVLDNFEQVISAASLVATLLAECPHLTILITSRQALELTGEHVYAVPPFTTTDPEGMAPSAAPHAPEAVQLFVERARARDASFELTPGNAGTIAAICTTLDGLPLAIELAAAQVPTLTPASLLPRLEERLSILTRGPIDTHDRHRTMRGAIEWSYDLLDASLQAAFGRLAVFAGGFTLEAAEAVTDDTADIIDTLSALVARSLIVAKPDEDGTTRYWMLETIREFGLERLAGSGDEAATRDRHADYFHAIAEWSDWAWFMSPAEGGIRLARLQADTANIRAALGWLQHQGHHSAVLHMAGCLGGLWVVLGHPREGQRWFEQSLDHGRDIPAAVRARALATMSWAVNTGGDPDRAVTLARESLAIWRTLDDPVHTAAVLGLCGVPAFRGKARYDFAAACFEECLSILSTLKHPAWISSLASMTICMSGQLAFIRGDVDQADTLYQSARDSDLARGYEPGESYVYGSAVIFGLADQARLRGNPAGALGLYQRCLALGWRHRNVRAVSHALGGIGGALAALGDHSSAARLFGACEALHEAFGFEFEETFDCQRALGLPEPWLRAGESFGDYQALRDSLKDGPRLTPIADPAGVDESWEAGRHLALADAINEALLVDIPTVPSHGLTARELEVLRAMVDGKPDTEIAHELYISRRTVATHVRHIYDKLEVSSRAEAAAWAVRNGVA